MFIKIKKMDDEYAVNYDGEGDELTEELTKELEKKEMEYQENKRKQQQTQQHSVPEAKVLANQPIKNEAPVTTTATAPVPAPAPVKTETTEEKKTERKTAKRVLPKSITSVRIRHKNNDNKRVSHLLKKSVIRKIASNNKVFSTTKQAKEYAQSLCEDIFRAIAEKACEITLFNRKKIITKRDVVQGMRVVSNYAIYG